MTEPNAPMDRVAKRILSHIASNLDFDASQIARGIGADESLVRERLGQMRRTGVLKGIDVHVDPRALGAAYEYLVTGVPTASTDRQAIDRLCGSGGVTRVFGMASAHSVAFTVRGSEASGTQARALELARGAGLMQVQAVMIVATFRDRTGFVPLESEKGAPRALTEA